MGQPETDVKGLSRLLLIVDPLDLPAGGGALIHDITEDTWAGAKSSKLPLQVGEDQFLPPAPRLVI